MEETPPCEQCAQLQREFELYQQLEAAYDTQIRLREELRRAQDRRIAALEERLRALERRRR